MSLQDDRRRLKEFESQAQKSFAPGIQSMLPMGYSGNGLLYQFGDIQTLVYNMFGSQQVGTTNPREKLNDYRLIYEKISPAGEVVSRKRALIGNPIIESKDKGFADAMNAYFDRLPSCGELRNPYAKDSGISVMLDQLIPKLYVDGSAFLTMIDANGDELQKPTSKLDAIRVHDSARFSYLQAPQVDSYDLHYIKQGIDTVIDKYRETFRVLQFNRTDYLWGKPLFYHSDFLIRELLIALGAREQSNARIGAPLEMTLFGVPLPAAQLDPAAAKMLSQDGLRFANAAADTYRQAIANKSTKLNQGVDVVGVAPADMKITKHRYGEGSESSTGFTEEFRLYLDTVAISWGYPTILLGLGDVGGGIGSEQFAYAATTANLSAATEQIYLSMNVVKPIIDRVMLTDRKTAPDYTVVWDGQTLQDQMKAGEVKKLNAEAIKIQLEAYELARASMSEEGQQDVADSFEWPNR